MGKHEDKYRIDHHKLIYHPCRVMEWMDAFGEWEKEKSCYPIYMEVSPVGYCNHHCKFCALDFLTGKKILLEKELLLKRLQEFSLLGVKSLMFAGEGEPTLHPDIAEILDFCTQVKLDTSLTTNFDFSGEEKLQSIMRNCKWIKVSMNGLDPENYALIHQSSKNSFNRVINNIEKALEIRGTLQQKCTIGVQLLLLPENASGVAVLAKKVKEIGVDYFVVKPYSHHPETIGDTYKDLDYGQYASLEEELSELNSSSFKTVFRFSALNKIQNNLRYYDQCYSVPFFWAYLKSTGDVFGCSCFLTNKNFCYGNINKQTFREVWESEERRACIQYVRNHLNAIECRLACRMDEINRYLWDLKHPNEHVNFI
ncbi:MAG: radical SAM protein [Oligoflexia bacterium]|nr:radical SAM protein [Oligoflexia bacterium]